jgi:hypothetical protein
MHVREHSETPSRRSKLMLRAGSRSLEDCCYICHYESWDFSLTRFFHNFIGTADKHMRGPSITIVSLEQHAQLMLARRLHELVNAR